MTMGKTAGCTVSCTGAGADRLMSYLIDVVQPRVKRSAHIGNTVGFMSVGNVGYWEYTVSCSGICLYKRVEIREVQTRKLGFLRLRGFFTHLR